MIKVILSTHLWSHLTRGCTVIFLMMAQSTGVYAEGAPTLAEAQSGFISNVSKIRSGLVTFQIADFRPKDNLLGSVGPSPKNTNVPIITGQVDVTLAGWGQFQWEANQFRNEERRCHLSADGNQAVAGVVDRLESFDGDVAKNLIRSFSTGADPMTTANLELEEGQLQGSRGMIGCNKPRVGASPVFRSLAYFSPGLLETENYFLDSFDPENLVMEGNRIVVARKGSDLKFVLDPDKSYMPVEVRSGLEGVDGFFQTISYINLDGVWFPETELTQKWDQGKLVYTTTCSLDTHEFNKDYPNDDFGISYPVGTEVEDILLNTQYVVDAN